jgi:hypothetical protein
MKDQRFHRASLRFAMMPLLLTLFSCADTENRSTSPSGQAAAKAEPAIPPVVPAVVAPTASEASAKPTFLSDGTVVRGQTRLVMRTNGTVDIVDDLGSKYTLFLSIPYKDSPGVWRSASHLKGLKVQADPGTQRVTLTGQAESPKGVVLPGEIRWQVSLMPEGTVRSELVVDTQAPLKEIIDGLTLIMSTTRRPLEGHQMKVDQETLTVVPATDQASRSLKIGKIQNVVWNADQPDRAIEVRTVHGGGVDVKDRHAGAGQVEVFYQLPAEQRIVLDIALPAGEARAVSPDTYAGIDFWASDKLRMPQYGLCRNLVQNPGFEAGFQYWRWNSMGNVKLDATADRHYDIVDDPSSPDGGRCLALRGEVGKAFEMVSTFGIPVDPDQTYTLSFYAKTDKPGQKLGYQTITGVWPIFPAGGTVALTDQWQRVVKTFKAPNRIVSLGFGNHNPTEDCWIYVDAVQIEQGDVATEYACKPVGAFLESDARGNCWQPGEDPQARLRIYGRPAAAGRITVTQEDFFGQGTDRGTLRFTLDGKGQASLSLPWAAQLAPGLYVQRLDYQLDDGFIDREFVRMTVLPFQDGTALHKDIFSLGAFDSRFGDWERRLAFLRNMGIGSAITFDPQPHKFYELLRQNNILVLVSIFDGGEGFFNKADDPRKSNPSLSGLTPEQRQEIEKLADIFDQRKTCHLSDEQLKQVEARAYQKAADYPEILYWKLNNEPPVQLYIDNPKETGAMIQVLRAARRGIARANPQAKVMSTDPANMYPNSGTAFINTLLEVSAGDPPFDIAAIHPYRVKPEEPDLDRDTQAFLDVLDRNQFKGDVWFTEGIYHGPYTIPMLDLDSHRGCTSDHYRGGDLSYAMGWGERMAAAYTARSWLVALKYGDRVKLYVDWGFRQYSICDVDLTPRPVVFAANTLVRVLGNATFKSDLILSDRIRCYVFQNEEDQPVAAIWAAADEVDRGSSPGFALDVGLLAKAVPGTQVVNFMGDSAAMPETLRVGPFPQFLVGPAGSMASFLDQLGQAVSDSGGELFPFLALADTDQVQLVVGNALGRDFRGKARISQGDKLLAEADLAIPARERWSWTMAQPLADNQVNATALTLDVRSEAGKEQRFDLAGTWMKWPKRKGAIVIDGDLADWDAGCFRMPLTNQMQFTLGPTDKRRQQYPAPPPWKGPDDLSAELHATWDDQHLYLAFKVRDDVHQPGPSVALAWQGDGLQLYFDGWADARSKRAKGYDNNDQAFMVWPAADLSAATLYREFAPERQLAFLNTGVVEAAKIAVRHTPDGFLVYECAIPAREIEPIKLGVAAKFGFGCLVNDADNDYRKRILTITPPETEPYRSPELYPTVILTE